MQFFPLHDLHCPCSPGGAIGHGHDTWDRPAEHGKSGGVVLGIGSKDTSITNASAFIAQASAGGGAHRIRPSVALGPAEGYKARRRHRRGQGGMPRHEGEGRGGEGVARRSARLRGGAAAGARRDLRA